eukprot:gene13391-15818_t
MPFANGHQYSAFESVPSTAVAAKFHRALQESHSMTDFNGMLKNDDKEKEYGIKKSSAICAEILSSVKWMVWLAIIFSVMNFFGIVWNSPDHDRRLVWCYIGVCSVPILTNVLLYGWLIYRCSSSKRVHSIVLMVSQIVVQTSLVVVGWIYQTHWIIPSVCLVGILRPLIDNSRLYWGLIAFQVTSLSLVLIIATAIPVIPDIFVMYIPGSIILWAIQWIHLRTENRFYRSIHLLEKEIAEAFLSLKHAQKDVIPSSSARRFLFENQLLLLCPPTDNSFRTEAAELHATQVKQDGHFAGILAIGFNLTPLSHSLSSTQLVELMHELWCMVDVMIDNTNKAIEQHRSERSKLNSDSLPFKVDNVGDVCIAQLLLDDYVPEAKQEAMGRLLLVTSSINQSIREYQERKPFGLPYGSIQLKMGLNFGPVLAGVVGTLEPHYHIFGDVLREAVDLKDMAYAGEISISSSIIKDIPSETDLRECFSNILSGV